MASPTAQTVALSKAVHRSLIALATGVAALAVFQWAELRVVAGGGHAICGINAVFNCEAVWSSSAAQRLHRWVGIPVAGLGLVWSLGAAFVLLALDARGRHRRPHQALVGALWLFAVAGVLGVALFVALSVRARSLCLTCLGTYALVLGFVFLVVARVPRPKFGSSEERVRVLLWTLGPVLGVYLLALVVGLLTPPVSPGSAVLQRVGTPAAAGSEPSVALEHFIANLSGAEREQLAGAIAMYRQSPPGPEEPARVLWGPRDAPVRIVEFTDVRCSHCRALVEQVSLLERAAPSGSFSVDARNFPLDSECNPLLHGSDGSHVRCLAAKVQICLERAPDFWTLRSQLFEAQQGLTPERVLAIGSSGSIPRSELEQCVVSPETAAKLQADIQYAAVFRPQGTPLVLLNGRQAPPLASFLYAMALTGGRTDELALRSLPSARMP